jgi:hypothetical protein
LVAARPFRRIQGSVGCGDEGVLVGGVGGEGRGTDGDGNPAGAAFSGREEVVGDGLAQSFGDTHGGFGRGVGEDDDEFFAAVACYDIAASYGAAENRRQFLQQDVAALVAVVSLYFLNLSMSSISTEMAAGAADA